ncbi:MAG: hypothetical protein LBF16_14925 [Pseudomonadales bacterium]|nr:hypothetical protein [Pseudomonadales bacterium]
MTPNIIRVKVDEVSQLFNTFDPTPFRERDVDGEAEEFIVDWARELPQGQPLRIVIYVRDAQAQKISPAQVKEALSSYFAYRANILSKELKELFHVGRLSFAIGLTILALGTMLSHSAMTFFGNGEIGRYASEGLSILGWVANWKPMEIFLYDWWPLARRRNLYLRLSQAGVDVRDATVLV